MHWLMKSEPSELSIDDLAQRPGRTIGWFGVRNYQARNFMMRDMKIGDQAFFYHSSCKVPGIYGIVEVCSAAYPDPTQFDARSEYFDAKSSAEKPRWFQVDVKFVRKTRVVPIDELRAQRKLATMLVLQRGNRLSITPVTAAQWNCIVKTL
jgi:predicted RNA-binding protein with PUA-like domain